MARIEAVAIATVTLPDGMTEEEAAALVAEGDAAEARRAQLEAEQERER